MFPEMSEYQLQEFRREVLTSVRKDGFQVRHRSKEFKYDEREAVYLVDMTIDSSSGIRLGQNVTVTARSHVPNIFRKYPEVEGFDVYYGNLLFKTVAFVEIPSRTGKLNFRNLFCALVCYGVAGTETGKLEREGNGKVSLFWVGSLQLLSWEVEK